jgi:hypothetical protein
MRRMYVGEDVIDLSGIDIVGAGDDDIEELLEGMDIVGARRRKVRRFKKIPVRRRKLKAQNKLARQVALARSAGGVVVRRQAERNRRLQWLPVGPSGVIAPAGNWALTLIPVRPCRLERPVFDATIGQAFDLNTYTIGGEPQLLGGGTIPLSVWAENAVHTGGLGASVVPGVPILLGGTNIGPLNAIVRGTIVCTSLV